MRVRIDQAKRLLADTDLPVFEIARKTGFAGQEAFSASFIASPASVQGTSAGVTVHGVRGKLDHGCAIPVSYPRAFLIPVTARLRRV